jgi:D-alanine-D-alanine ligase
MSRIVVLAGGKSDERDVSLRSGEAVKAALQKIEFEVIVVDPADNPETYLSDLKNDDIVFPALHGKEGEDGIIQRYFEANHIRYIGSDSKSSELCFDKFRYTEFLKSNGILVPETELVDYEQYKKSALTQQPYVLKPNDGGSSIDTFIIRDPEDIDEEAIKASFQRHNKLLLQALILGTEITVGMLNEHSLPVIEIIPPSNQEFDYKNKYNGATQELCPPINVSHDVQNEAKKLTERINQLCGCRDMSRTDIIITKSSRLFVLETNTIPGLTPQSLLPKAAFAAGHTMVNLCDSLIYNALAR